ncbi:hypothetical protein QYM36_008675, partial [Artemia franciscana]
RNFEQAIGFHNHVLRIAQELGDKNIEARAYAGLGHAARCIGDYMQAKKWHEKQLDMALALRDKTAEGRACSNLGIVYQLLGDHDAALKLHNAHLNIARSLQDRAGMGRAYGNIGNAYSAMGYYDQAIKYHKQELTISKEVNDRSSEASTHGNLAVAYQALGMFDMAVIHYHSHLNIARELKDTAGEACALLNLGNCHSSRGEFAQAISFYENYLMLSQELQDIEGEAKACHFLGYAHYCLQNYKEAIRYYDQDLALAKDLQDKVSMGRAYCNLGLAHLALGNTETALDCQKYFLSKSSSFYKLSELTIRQEISDAKGECRAHGHLAGVHMALGNYTHAIRCYEEQLEKARELREASAEAQAYGNLGIARMNMGHFEDAIVFFESQLTTLDRINNATAILDKGRAYGNLGDCYDSLNHYEDAVRCHEQYLAIALKSKSIKDQERAYRGLGNSHKLHGNLQQALVCFEKRLVVSHELSQMTCKAQAYGELGHLHSMLGNYEQALSCLEHQISIARELGDRILEAEASSGLGLVYHRMGDNSTALQYHQLDYEIAESTSDPSGQCRALGNIGLCYESLGNLEDAVSYQEQHLSAAVQNNDKSARATALFSLGRLHHTLGHTSQAISYLEQSLQLAEALGRREDEAKIHHRLGVAAWTADDLEKAKSHLEKATALLELVRRDNRRGQDQRLALFDLQTGAYHALQRVLIGLGKADEALLLAERARTRAFVDLLLDRKRTGPQFLSESARATRLDENIPTSIEETIAIINRQKASMLYFSIAAGYLYIWLLVPEKGIVAFHEVALNEIKEDPEVESDEEKDTFVTSLLEQHIQGIRDALGVELQTSNMRGCDGDGDTDIWSQHLEELGDRLNQDSDRTGFLRMVNRTHAFNSSNYSLSSLFSLGSVSGSITTGSTSRAGSTRSRKNVWQGPACLRSLYELLIAPFEEHLPQSTSGSPKELMLVLEGDLFLVPFPVLKALNSSEYLSERYSLIVVPSLSSLRTSQKTKPKSLPSATNDGEGLGCSLVVGNPKIPCAVSEQWGWGDLPYAAQEAEVVSEMLQAAPLTGINASKEVILRTIAQAECIHFATHVSWKLSAVVLSPGEFSDRKHEDDENTEVASTIDLPALSEFLLTAADVLNLRLNARLVVLSSVHSRDHHGWASSDGVVALSRAFLAAGAQCVLLSLWPVPDTAVKIMLRTFYSSLLQGSRVSRALSEAQQTVQHTKHFAHPANWAGFLLIGSDIRLSNKVAMMGAALGELLKTPEKCRDALRVILHLVEKSLQRILRGHRNAMYTTQRSIENKVGPVLGWKEILISVGFRFEPATNNIPAAVFFPQSDPGERLSQCSASLQALLGLSTSSLCALTKLLANPESADDIIAVMRNVVSQTTQRDLEAETVEVRVPVTSWRLPGGHELLASLGFDLMEVGQDEVTLRTSKQASRRNAQFALQALVTLFDTDDAPNSLNVDSSSLESLESSDEEPAAPLPTLPSYPPRRMVPLVLGSKSAFSSYVRSKPRGEPDGRTAAASETRGRESDAAFTPSPVETLQGRKGEKVSPAPSLQMSLTLAHQTRIRAMYTRGGNASPASETGNSGSASIARPESSSSASSVNDWESGQSTVRRQPITKPQTNTRVSEVSAFISSRPKLGHVDSETMAQRASKLTLPLTGSLDALDRLSVRSEVGKARKRDRSTEREVLLTRSEERIADMKLKPFHPKAEPEIFYNASETGTKKSIQDHILANQINRLNRELPITDVYHERRVGIGIAPPLSKLLLANEERTLGNSDDTVNSFERLTVNEAIKDVIPPVPPKRPAVNFLHGAKWLHPHEENGTEMLKRDEADGRSMTDSNYSGYSPNRANLKPVFKTRPEICKVEVHKSAEGLDNCDLQEHSAKEEEGLEKRVRMPKAPTPWNKSKLSSAKSHLNS